MMASDQQASRETISISALPKSLRGATALAALAYPGSKEQELQQLAAFRLSALWRHALNPIDVPWVWAESFGAAIPIDFAALNGGRKRLEERFRKRLVAGNLALNALRRWEVGPRAPRAKRRAWNQAAAIVQVCEELNIEPKNFLHRYWYPSFPVLHLAAAWVSLQQDALHKGKLRPDELWRPNDPEFLARLLGQAEQLEQVLPECGIKISKAELIQFRDY